MKQFTYLGITMNDISKEEISPLHLNDLFTNELADSDVICLVDGEHYPPVTKATLEVLEEKGACLKALVFLGGTEKVKDPVEELKADGNDREVYIAGSKGSFLKAIEKSLDDKRPDAVVDLSDEPVVNYEDRFEIASAVLKHGVSYMGSDFFFEAPEQNEVLNKPSLSVIGTGKRVGKTGVSVSIARIMKKHGYEPVIVCMGRGGPSEPVFVDTRERKVDAEMLLEIAESGKHAASDYLEDALLAEVPTVGCRRCGGGMAGNPFSSNVVAGAEKTRKTSQRFVIMEGSGSTVPPVKTDKRIVLIGAGQPLDHILKYFGRYRIKTSDLAVVTMCEEPLASDEKVKEIEKGIMDIKEDMDYLLTRFRPKPLGDISGKKVFVASTAPESIMPTIEAYIEENFGCDLVGTTNNLSDRGKLKIDLEEGMERAEVLLTEVKAASIDVAGAYAKNKGADIVFMHNELEVVGGNVESVERAVLSLCEDPADKKEERS